MPETQPLVACVKCGYDLRGADHARCPECGWVVDPRARPWRRRWLKAGLAIAAVVYMPFAWLAPFYIWRWDSTEYVLFWMKRWPILPGLSPTYLFSGFVLGRPLDEPWREIVMGGFTLIMLAGFTWIGARSRRALAICVIVALLISMLNSCGAYMLFRA